MSQTVSRRGLIQGLVAGALVLGFDPRSRSWVTEARADGPLIGLPPLDGTLAVDPASRQAAADDFGHIVSRQPIAVLRPGSVNDIVAMVRYARAQGLSIAMRGQGHSQYGQAQVQGGIVIDSSTLNTIHSIAPDRAVVDPGVLWSELFDAATAQGLTPPVLTDYMELSVGATLSIGGIGGASQHFGVQSDNALELEVVTGRGDLVTCSPCQNADLFEVVLSGVGQYGIIVRATVRLTPAETTAQVFHLYYDDVERYVRDQLRLLGDGRFSYLEGQVVANASGTGWRYMIEAASYYTPPAAPDQAALLAGLSDDRASLEAFTQSYRDWAYRIEPTIAFLKAIGAWGFPHPWVDLFVPASVAARFVGGVVSTLTLADTGQGPVLFYPINTRRFTRPLFRVPAEPSAFLFSILRTAPPGDPATLNAMLASNRDLYDRLRALGGTRYTPNAIPNFTAHDWQRHYHPYWGLVVSSKRRFDPDNVLTPGPGIFA